VSTCWPISIFNFLASPGFASRSDHRSRNFSVLQQRVRVKLLLSRMQREREREREREGGREGASLVRSISVATFASPSPPPDIPRRMRITDSASFEWRNRLKRVHRRGALRRRVKSWRVVERNNTALPHLPLFYSILRNKGSGSARRIIKSALYRQRRSPSAAALS